jgi:hypothetical protein
VKDSTAEDVDLTVSTSGLSDTATTTIYDNVDNVDVAFNTTGSVANGSGVAATATLETNGSAIEVPRVDVDFNSTNTTVASSADTAFPTTVPTEDDGTALVNVSADAEGSADITATSQNTEGSNTLTVGEATANFAVSNVSADNSTVTTGENVTVTADIENTGSAQATQTVEFRLDTDQNGTLEGDEELQNTSVQLDAGSTQTVTFEDISTDGLSAGDYTHGVFSDDDSDTATLTVEAQADAPANFDVSNVTPDGQNVTAGDSIDVTADVENIGGQSGTQTLSFRLDTNQDDELAASEELDNSTVTIDAGNSTEVEFTNIDTTGLNASTYTHGVFSENSSATATITVEEAAPGDVPSWVDNANITEEQFRAFDADNSGDLVGDEVRSGVEEYINSLPNGEVDGTSFVGDDITALVEGYLNNL